MSASPIFVGIDVSQQELVIAQHPHVTAWTVANDTRGIEQLVDRVRDLAPVLIVLEATGGLEIAAFASLTEAQLPVQVVNPTRVRGFATAVGSQAKTDTIDAQLLADFAQAIRPQLRPHNDPATLELQALVSRRRQILDMIAAEEHRLQRSHRSMQPDIRAHIAWLRQRVKGLDDDISRTIRSQPLWRAKQDLLMSVKGVGPAVSAALIAHLPELGSLTHKKIATLVGVAPFNRDSGKSHGKRTIRAGRSTIRSALYMAALVATRYNPAIRTFYGRLRTAGKPPKVALTACLHKLLIVLNAIVRDNVTWRPALDN